MKTETVYLKRSIEKDGLPKFQGWYKTDGQDRWFSVIKGCFVNTPLNKSFNVDVEWYLE
jgi:hypothetical protein